MMDSRAQYSRGRRQGDCAPRHHRDRTDQGGHGRTGGTAVRRSNSDSRRRRWVWCPYTRGLSSGTTSGGSAIGDGWANSGGGGNRKQRISRRSRQLQVIAGNPIPSDRNQNTRKSTFGKTLCQLAKSNARPRREGRTWETCPPPRPWAAWHARFFRAHVTQTLAAWRAPCWSFWRLSRS